MRTPTPSDSASAERALRAVRPEVRELEGYAAPARDDESVKLNQNENPYELPADLKEEILDGMRRLEWTRYPSYDPPPVREKVAARFGVHPDQVLLGNGSNQLLYLLGTALVEPGDAVVVCPPTFSLFELVSRLGRASLTRVEQRPDFSLDEEAVLRAAAGAKLTFLCSPNNPTGRPVSISFLEAVLGRTSGLVVWDEAYAEFWGETALPLLERHPNLLVLKTFSKAFGLAGLRVGTLFGHPALVAELRKVNIPYNIGLMSGLAAVKLLDRPEVIAAAVAAVLSERRRLSGLLSGLPRFTAFPSAANFILLRAPDGRGLYEALRARGVLVRPMGGHPLLENCVRVTVGRPAENDAFLSALQKSV